MLFCSNNYLNSESKKYADIIDNNYNYLIITASILITHRNTPESHI